MKIACFCGQLFDGDELSVCSRCQTPVTVQPNVEAWVRERRALLDRIQRPYASPQERGILTRRVKVLSALIGEHSL